MNNVTLSYRIVNNWHIITSKELQSLYIAEKTAELAFKALPPLLETLGFNHANDI